MTKSIQVHTRKQIALKTIRDLAGRNFPVEQISEDTNQVTLITLLLDASGSMSRCEDKVCKYLDKLKTQLLELDDYYAILWNIIKFSSTLEGDGYQLVQDVDIRYKAEDATALYDAIDIGGQNMINYTKELKKNK